MRILFASVGRSIVTCVCPGSSLQERLNARAERSKRKRSGELNCVHMRKHVHFACLRFPALACGQPCSSDTYAELITEEFAAAVR